MTQREIKAHLEILHQKYHRPEFLGSDPITFVHRYPNPIEAEAVAVLSALMAYGNVTQIQKSISRFLEIAHSEWGDVEAWLADLRSPKGRKKARQAFGGIRHRFNSADDFLLLLSLVAREQKERGSLGAFFESLTRPEDRTIEGGLSRMIQSLKAQSKDLRFEFSGLKGFEHLLNDPAQGSSCKRWVMFLRWMARKDSIDIGLWHPDGELGETFEIKDRIHPSRLIVPLDTHMWKISRMLGLTERKTSGWKASLEVTAGFGEFAPEDPVKYDFCLTRIGILKKSEEWTTLGELC